MLGPVRENAIMCGMTEHQFRHSTLSEINLRLKKFKEEKEYRQKEIEYHSWLTGAYVQKAIGSCLSKKIKYPENPLEEKVISEEIELTEEKADFYRKEFLKRLQRMEKRFNNSNKENADEK